MTETPAADAASAPAARKRSGGLSSMLLADLKSMAAGMGIAGAGSMKKAQLVDAIKAAQSGGGAARPAQEQQEQPEQPKQEQPKQERSRRERPAQAQPAQEQPQLEQPQQEQPQQEQPPQEPPRERTEQERTEQERPA